MGNLLGLLLCCCQQCVTSQMDLVLNSEWYNHMNMLFELKREDMGLTIIQCPSFVFIYQSSIAKTPSLLF